MNKDLIQNKVYNYFNKRDTKTQEKCGKIAGKIEYTLLLQEQKHWFWEKKIKLRTS